MAGARAGERLARAHSPSRAPRRKIHPGGSRSCLLCSLWRVQEAKEASPQNTTHLTHTAPRPGSTGESHGDGHRQRARGVRMRALAL